MNVLCSPLSGGAYALIVFDGLTVDPSCVMLSEIRIEPQKPIELVDLEYIQFLNRFLKAKAIALYGYNVRYFEKKDSSEASDETAPPQLPTPPNASKKSS